MAQRLQDRRHRDRADLHAPELTDDQVVLVGENNTATSTDTIKVRPDGAGSEITYTADIEMNGAAKLATPVMKLVFEKLGNDTEDDMVTVLDRLAPGTTSASPGPIMTIAG